MIREIGGERKQTPSVQANIQRSCYSCGAVYSVNRHKDARIADRICPEWHRSETRFRIAKHQMWISFPYYIVAMR